MTADEWNQHHPKGTTVRYFPVIPVGPKDEWLDTVTRSEARELPSGAVVVLIEGRNGGISISHLLPLHPGDRTASQAITQICDAVGRVGIDGVGEERLQELITEIHCICMLTDPRTDPGAPQYVRPDACHPSLLERARDLLGEVAGDAATYEAVAAWCKEADRLLRPNDPTPEI